MPTAAPHLTGAGSAVDAEGHARHGAHLGDFHAATARGGAGAPLALDCVSALWPGVRSLF
jgi:hypothetical protein